MFTLTHAPRHTHIHPTQGKPLTLALRYGNYACIHCRYLDTYDSVGLVAYMVSIWLGVHLFAVCVYLCISRFSSSGTISVLVAHLSIQANIP